MKQVCRFGCSDAASLIKLALICARGNECVMAVADRVMEQVWIAPRFPVVAARAKLLVMLRVRLHDGVALMFLPIEKVP